MNSIKLLFLISIPVILASCATLNKSECLNADWQAIGLEDGSAGRDATYVQKHGKACSEHDSVPDVEQYQLGYEAGLERFCTARMGLWLGETGQDFKDVCPAELGGDYLKGYEKGHRFFRMLEEID